LAQLEKEQKVGEQTALFERDSQIKEAQRQQAVRVAQLDKEQKIGEQTASFEREAQVKDAERAMRIALAEANAKAIAGESQAQAEKRRIEAEGQASAIFAKLDAEARGQFEILAKKGDGLRRIIEACGGAPQAFQLLMLEHLDELAHTAAQAISNIKFDKVVVWENGGGQ